MTYKIQKISPTFDMELIKRLRLQRHSNKKRSNRKALSNIKEKILALSSDERGKLKDLVV